MVIMSFPARALDRLDAYAADDPVAGAQRPLVDEALVAVHHPRVVEAEFRVERRLVAGRAVI